jgi:hypothetical protein
MVVAGETVSRVRVGLKQVHGVEEGAETLKAKLGRGQDSLLEGEVENVDWRGRQFAELIGTDSLRYVGNEQNSKQDKGGIKTTRIVRDSEGFF